MEKDAFNDKPDARPPREAYSLRRVSIKVRPAPFHPQYWEWDGGYLSLFIYGFSDQDAVERALKILAQLPYEMVESGVAELFTGQPSPLFDQDFQRATEIGFAMRVDVMGTGAAGDEFESR